MNTKTVFHTSRGRLAGALRAALWASLPALLATGAFAHGARVGDIEIEHPFATPTPAGAVNGAAYVAKLDNTGQRPDRLLRVSSPVAAHSEIHTMSVDAGGVMRMREVGEIALAPGQPVAMAPGAGLHLMLIGLKQPLREGESFPMTMTFEHAGSVEVQVVVQAPKPHASGAMADHSMH